VTVRTRSGPVSSRPHFFRGEYAAVTLIGCVVVILCILIGGHLYGRFLSARDLGGRDIAIEQMRAESQKQKRDIDGKSAQITELQRKVMDAQAALEAILPQKETYNIVPNQTLIVGDGHLMLGLIGSPANEGVLLNINGKQQVVPAGQVITVTPDASTNCRVSVQSFDMFKALVHATCSGAKPQ
jgi:hypothetical protein